MTSSIFTGRLLVVEKIERSSGFVTTGLPANRRPYILTWRAHIGSSGDTFLVNSDDR